LASSRHGAGVAQPVPNLLEAWQRFVALLAEPEARPFVGTAEAVEALLARSALQRTLEGGAELDAAVIAETDEHYRRQAGTLRDSTRVALYGSDQPVTDWWWRVAELADGPTGNAFVDVAAAAREKGVHPHTVRAAIHSEILPARRLGRTFLIHQRDLLRWQPRGVGRPSARPGRDGDELLAAFNAANTRQNWDRANAVAKLIAERPTTARRCLALALNSFNLRKHEEAVRWVDQARELGLDPRGQVTAAITAASSLLWLGRAEDAIAETEGVEAPPDLELPLAAVRVDARIAQSDLSGARVEAKGLLKRHPDEADPQLLAARVEFHGGDLVRALEHVVRFRSKAADLSEGLMLHGSILGKLGDALDDRGLYKQALHLFWRARPQEGWRAVARIGLSLAKLGRWRPALRLARTLAQNGQTSAARELADSALKAAEGHADGAQLAAALDLAEAWVGTSRRTKLYRAFVLGTAGEWHEASKLIDAIEDRYIDALDLRLLRVTAMIAAGRTAEAFALSGQLPLEGTPLAVLPDLLQLRLVQGESADEVDDAKQLKLQDTMREVLGRLAEQENSLGLLSGLWLASEETHWKREAAIAQSVLATVDTSMPSETATAHTWDVDHRRVSSPAERVATIAA